MYSVYHVRAQQVGHNAAMPFKQDLFVANSEEQAMQDAVREWDLGLANATPMWAAATVPYAREPWFDRYTLSAIAVDFNKDHAPPFLWSDIIAVYEKMQELNADEFRSATN